MPERVECDTRLAEESAEILLGIAVLESVKLF